MKKAGIREESGYRINIPHPRKKRSIVKISNKNYQLYKEIFSSTGNPEELLSSKGIFGIDATSITITMEDGTSPQEGFVFNCDFAIKLVKVKNCL